MSLPSSEPYPVAIQKQLDAVSETANMVTELGPPNSGEGPDELMDRLLTTRAAMSRVSELVGEMILLQGRASRALTTRKGELEDAEANVTASKKVQFTEDYSSAKERNAKMAASTVEERIKVRETEKLLGDINTVLAYARERHRELDRAVRDIDTRLRILSI